MKETDFHHESLRDLCKKKRKKKRESDWLVFATTRRKLQLGLDASSKVVMINSRLCLSYLLSAAARFRARCSQKGLDLKGRINALCISRGDEERVLINIYLAKCLWCWDAFPIGSFPPKYIALRRACRLTWFRTRGYSASKRREKMATACFCLLLIESVLHPGKQRCMDS